MGGYISSFVESIGRTKSTRSYYTHRFFDYQKIRVHFDALFIESIKSFITGDMANEIDNMLRSPMGNQYGI